jgi:hypothetical protein
MFIGAELRSGDARQEHFSTEDVRIWPESADFRVAAGTTAVQLIWTSRQPMTPPGNARLVRFLRGQFCQNAAFRLVQKLFNFQAFEIDFRHGGYASGLCEFAIDL